MNTQQKIRNTIYRHTETIKRINNHQWNVDCVCGWFHPQQFDDWSDAHVAYCDHVTEHITQAIS